MLNEQVELNNAGQLILASGAGNNVSLQASATISGGTLKSTGGGLVSVVAGNAATADGTARAPSAWPAPSWCTTIRRSI